MENSLTHDRRFDIDWLRVIAIGLLLIYHIAIGFQPWGGFIGFILSNESLESIWVPMSALNVWRIPILFFVSGMGVCFAMRKRSWKELIKERALRILMPFLFGMAFIVPLHWLVWQSYYDQPLQFLPQPGHLWFLGNLFVYVLLLSPIFYWLKKNREGKVHRFLAMLFQNPFGLIVVMIPFLLEAIIVNPVSFETYAMTWHGFFIGLLAFFFGYCFIYAGSGFTATVKRWKWLFLAIAIALFSYRLLVLELVVPNYLLSIESNFWIFGVFGIVFTYLNKPSRLLSYLSKAVYPVYIIHMAFLYLGSVLIFPLDIPLEIQFVLLILFTGISCLLTYEFVIKRVKFLRPFFGLTY
ncbi:acyltransferase family protein [Roseivirga misakiensis]|uniref:Acyltransferase n=1 Tax=Roseivirga misakiensis TaxID=1563681 RepID=A0A1E5T805_9BACT|nr:acyltransferase [Roseivirga misakiensis]OEK07509.1 acyltransferase [Roseivirga misakiensis]